MKINEIEIPDAASTTQYIPDAIGGWMYVVTTTVSVLQKNLVDFQAQVDNAKAQVAELQAFIAEAEPQANEFATALAAQPEPAPLT